jgi:hypothetical protein
MALRDELDAALYRATTSENLVPQLRDTIIDITNKFDKANNVIKKINDVLNGSSFDQYAMIVEIMKDTK